MDFYQDATFGGINCEVRKWAMDRDRAFKHMQKNMSIWSHGLRNDF